MKKDHYHSETANAGEVSAVAGPADAAGEQRNSFFSPRESSEGQNANGALSHGIGSLSPLTAGVDCRAGSGSQKLRQTRLFTRSMPTLHPRDHLEGLISSASLPRRGSSYATGARVLWLAATRVFATALAVSAALTPLLRGDGDGAVAHHTTTTPPYIFVSFVGGFVRRDNPHHGPVILAHRMQQDSPKGAHIEVFENRHRRTAYETILHVLDSNHDGILSNEEKTQARIVLVGQSWGASAVVLLARELDRIGIPVLLTVQVDSVAKPWQDDGIIPDNVAAAVNFYQPHGVVHGRPIIRAADHSKTQILGNFRYDYSQTPVTCDGMPWFERAFIPGHMHTECDISLWGRVETLVRQHLEVQSSVASATPQP